MEVKGTITKIWKTTPNGWFSGKFIDSNNDTYSICGIMNISPTENVEYIFEGNFQETENYGKQLKIKSGRINNENNLNVIRQFLNSNFIKGINIKTTEKIVRAFKNDTLNILENNPEKLLEIKGISQKKLELIKQSYDSNKGFVKFFEATNGEITENMSRKILNTYNNDSDKALKALYENPYEFIEKIDGIGFLKADSIAEKIHIDKKSLFRAEAVLSYILLKASNDEGHMYLNFEDLQNKSLELLNPFPYNLGNKTLEESIMTYSLKHLDDEIDFMEFNLPEETRLKVLDWFYDFDDYLLNIATALNNNIQKGINIIEEDEYEDDRIYYKSLYQAETEGAKLIYEIAQKKPLKSLSDDFIDEEIKKFEYIENEKLKSQGILSDFKLNKEQVKAIHTSLNHNLSIITGGPGRGKTEVLNVICSFFKEDEIILCAPTGKASQKMRDATHNESASTIHRLIYDYSKGKRSLIKDVKNKLLIVDESSMIDMKLAYDLLTYAKDCQIIFVGDKDQLQSVGTGTFFNDILLCDNIPKTTLIQCFRNTGSIVYNCDRVNAGGYFKTFMFDDVFKFKHVESDSIIKETINSYITLYNNNVPLKDICILCPMNKGKLGSYEINRQIRELIIPKGTKQLFGYYLNDRIMVIKNSYQIPTIKNGVSSLGLFNGDIGTITRIVSNDDDEYLELTLDDGRVAKITNENINILELAYSMTIHKSQGSEYKYIIIPFVTSYYMMLQRNLLYTGISRAKINVEILGQEKAINIATQRQIEILRNTKFLMKINKLFSKKEEY